MISTEKTKADPAPHSGELKIQPTERPTADTVTELGLGEVLRLAAEARMQIGGNYRGEGHRDVRRELGKAA